MASEIDFLLANLRARHVLRKAVRSTGNFVLFREDGGAIFVGDGGKGSGNWGHEGRKGKLGGSAPGGGVHNRITEEGGTYTSFSKKQKKLAMIAVGRSSRTGITCSGVKVTGMPTTL